MQINKDGLAELLLEEMDLLKEKHPAMIRMFMDLVEVVSSQNNQLGEITKTLDIMLGVIAQKDVLIQEHEWKLNILKDRILGTEVSEEAIENIFSGFTKDKDTLLN
jgi:hypothetical protein